MALTIQGSALLDEMIFEPSLNKVLWAFQVIVPPGSPVFIWGAGRIKSVDPAGLRNTYKTGVGRTVDHMFLGVGVARADLQGEDVFSWFAPVPNLVGTVNLTWWFGAGSAGQITVSNMTLAFGTDPDTSPPLMTAMP